MENIKLKPKKPNLFDNIKGLFENKQIRYKYLLLFILPFVIAIAVFGFVAFKEVKNLAGLVTGSNEIKSENVIEKYNYVLRNNATEYQKECFAELKQAIEVEYASDETIAGLVCKNFIADHYTWSNKQGQYDVGGMYYLFSLEKSKENAYIQARDSFYKYLSKYIKDYGVTNLLEVDNIQINSVTKLDVPYFAVVNTHFYDEEAGHSYIDTGYEFEEDWNVSCSWTYKSNSKFDTSSYATSMNFIVVINNGRFEIIEASEKPIEVVDHDDIEDENIENDETESEENIEEE